MSESSALVFGRAFHEVLAAWWEGGLEAAVVKLIEIAPGLDEQQAAQMAALIRHYGPPRSKYTLEAIEHTFVTPIRNPDTGRSMRGVVLAGKVDGLVTDGDGRRWVLEHKTTSHEIIGFGFYWQRLAIDHQVAFYLLATESHGILYDVVRTFNIKLCGTDRKKAAASAYSESPADAYQRRCEDLIRLSPSRHFQFREIHKTADDIAEAQQDLWQQAHMLAECYRQGRWPRNADACRGYYGMCPYLQVCVGQASLDDDELYRTKADSHEELMEIIS